MIGNPVLHKELFMRLRLRQVPMPAKIGIGVLVLGCLMLFYGIIGKYLIESTDDSVGRNAWIWCVSIQYTLICLIAPVVTANCITQEKEQQTWEMLVFTRLKPFEIILGKLVARLAIIFVVLALFCPLTVFCWLRSAVLEAHTAGSAQLAEFVMSYAVIFISTVFFATFGLMMSWQLQKTIFAIMLAYTFVIGFLLIGTALLWVMFQWRFSDSNSAVKFPPLWINPVFLIGYAVSPDNTANSTLFVVYGLLCYVVGTLVMLWRMILGFYHFTYDGDDDPNIGPMGAVKGFFGRADKRAAAERAVPPAANDRGAPEPEGQSAG